jgi:hypothetical protein
MLALEVATPGKSGVIPSMAGLVEAVLNSVPQGGRAFWAVMAAMARQLSTHQEMMVTLLVVAAVLRNPMLKALRSRRSTGDRVVNC